MIEETVGERAADTLVKQHEEQGDLAAFVREPIGVTGAIPLDQAVGFQSAQVVADLGERIGRGRKA